MRSYFDGMLRYFELSGRSTRMQYWMFFVVQYVLAIAAIAIDLTMGGLDDPRLPNMPATLYIAFVHVIPSITVSVRRLHDIGRSGFWYLLYFVPFAGLVLLYWSCCASEPGRNAYDDPEPRNDKPRGGRLATAGSTTIPRAVRMGNNAARPAVAGYDGLSSPERFI